VLLIAVCCSRFSKAFQSTGFLRIVYIAIYSRSLGHRVCLKWLRIAPSSWSSRASFEIDLLASLKQFVTFTLLFNYVYSCARLAFQEEFHLATGLALSIESRLSVHFLWCKYWHDEYFAKTVNHNQPASLNFMCWFRPLVFGQEQVHWQWCESVERDQFS
jgi:hypothetical protein